MRALRWLSCLFALILATSACGSSDNTEEGKGLAADTGSATGTGPAPGEPGGEAFAGGADGSSAVPSGTGTGSDAKGGASVTSGGAAPGAAGDSFSAEGGGTGTASDSGAAGASAPDPAPQAGQLTAGAWDDNLNFERFQAYRSELLQSPNVVGAASFTNAEHEAAFERFGGERDANDLLDIAIVIDTTGSMGDEIAYLQTELDAIAARIEQDHPDADARFALIAYKDEGDSYVVQSHGFVDQVDGLGEALAALEASGGGDFPEAPDAAIAAAADLQWRTGEKAARLLLWVADAPHHAQNAEAMTAAVRQASELDVHVYPVASSGIDELTELTMRSAAQLTGGRYLFLTDDSGIGGAHKEPTIPCYFVTRLDHALLRMVDIELSGQYREPTAAEVIRTTGDPQDGSCKLESGDTVASF